MKKYDLSLSLSIQHKHISEPIMQKRPKSERTATKNGATGRPVGQSLTTISGVVTCKDF